MTDIHRMSSRLRRLAGCGILGLLLCSGADLAAREVRVTGGMVAGTESAYESGVLVWKGIPFARPPLGEQRWRPPLPPEPWPGVRPAVAAGAPCFQPLVPETSIYSRGPISPSEDCLYLNVWAPAEGSTPRAVLVWFHGGGNSTGHGSSLIFDGSRLAARGMVVVTANYRMGPFGFLAHPDLSAESAENASGNYGLLDQLAALEWVQDNIAAFGGDPDRVVIFGQSAGSIDSCLLMASPLSRGLISGVIGISGGCLQVTTTLTEAEADGQKVFARFPGRDLGALRQMPAAAFAEGAEAAEVPLARPIIDGWVVPEAPRRLYAEGRHNPVPLIVGDMADEFRGLGADMAEMTPEAYEAAVRESFPVHAGRLLEAYAPLAAVSPREAYRKISTHSFFTWQSRTWADLVRRSGGNAWVYHFTHPTAVFSLYIPERPEFPDPNGPRGMGAYHSGDLAYHFNTVGIVGLGWEDWDFELADLISRYWVNFANSGNPNGPDLPDWPIYERAADRVQEFGTNRVWTVRHPQHERLNLFDAVYPPPESDAR